MTHPTLVDSYLDRILLPELALCTLSPAQQKILALDVRDRLNSLLAHWGDVAFRRAVLLIGLEEASFYEPAAADLEVRALVNVAIRNSLLEDLAASNASMPELTFPRPIITDVGMAVLTETAVEFFQKMGLTNIAPLAPGAPDVFGKLTQDYRRAWFVLWQLANGPGAEVTYRLPDAPVPVLPPLTPLKQKPKAEITVVLSGMDATFDPGLLHFLKQIADKKVPFFFADSFKAITRNPRKLCHIIDYVLSQGAALVTHNYFISPAYAARREPLLRPFHWPHEAKAKLVNEMGLQEPHRKALHWIKARL